MIKAVPNLRSFRDGIELEDYEAGPTAQSSTIAFDVNAAANILYTTERGQLFLTSKALA